MLNIQKTVTFSGISNFEVNGVSKPFAYFNANVGTDKKPSVTHSIQDMDLFLANKSVFEADRKEFEDTVYAFVEK